ncbi:putative Cobalamin biosynthesis protein CobD [Gammaproteobacteria bacterium]
MGQWIQIHPPVIVGRLARRLGVIFAAGGRISAVLGLLLVLIPAVGITSWLAGVPRTGLLISDWGEFHGNGPLRPLPMHFSSFLFQMLVVWLTLGGARLISRASALREGLESGNYLTVTKILDSFPPCEGSRWAKCSDLAATEATSSGVAAILAGGCREVYAPLFWSALAGAPGAVAYRLVQILAVTWDPAREGWAAARLAMFVEWLPVRLTALIYVLNSSRLRRSWRYWHHPPLPIPLAAGVSALGLRLRMPTTEDGPGLVVGEGQPPIPQDVLRAADLVQWGAWLWVAVVVWLGMMRVLVS